MDKKQIAAWVGGSAAVLLLGVIVVTWWNRPNRPVSPEAAAAQVAAATSLADVQQCTGRVKSYTFGKDPIQVNPDGQCRVNVQWADNLPACIFVKAEGDDTVYGPHGSNCPTAKKGERYPTDVEYVWSAGKPFKGKVVLYPRNSTQLVRWK